MSEARLEVVFRRRLTALLLLLSAFGLAGSGCAASGAPPATTATGAEDDDVADALVAHHRYHHPGGLTLFVTMSLDTVGISPEQQVALDAVRGQLQGARASAHAADQALTTELARGVVAGAIDRAQVDTAVARLRVEAARATLASAGALDSLHALLNPSQRATLADKVLAHWAVWEIANADEQQPPKPGEGALTALALELELTADQVDHCRSGLRVSMAELPRLDVTLVTSELHAFGEAFRSVTFDARTLTAAREADAVMASWGASHMARFVEVVTPMLTAPQRDKLARSLLEHTTHGTEAEARR